MLAKYNAQEAAMRVVSGKLWPDARQGSTVANVGRGLASALHRFSRAKRGDVAILFGLMALALFMMIGLAVDYGRFLSARNQTLAATDAAHCRPTAEIRRRLLRLQRRIMIRRPSLGLVCKTTASALLSATTPRPLWRRVTHR